MGCGDGSVTFLEEYAITTPRSTGKRVAQFQLQAQKKRNSDVDKLCGVDNVVTHANSSQCEAQLYILEDHEA